MMSAIQDHPAVSEPHPRRPPVSDPDGPAAADAPTAAARFRPLARLALTGLLIALCLVVSYPLLPAITWAVALAIIAWPLHAWLGRLRRPWLAAGLTTLA